MNDKHPILALYEELSAVKPASLAPEDILVMLEERRKIIDRCRRIDDRILSEELLAEVKAHLETLAERDARIIDAVGELLDSTLIAMGFDGEGEHVSYSRSSRVSVQDEEPTHPLGRRLRRAI